MSFGYYFINLLLLLRANTEMLNKLKIQGKKYGIKNNEANQEKINCNTVRSTYFTMF